MTVEIRTEKIILAARALEDRVRKDHPDMPKVVFTLASSRTVHGHFAPSSWKTGSGDAHHEIFLSGESLARGAEGTLGTLLHEFAHALNHHRGVRDTSNGNVYHNGKFKAMAEELGLTIGKAGHHGWTHTTVPKESLTRYSKEYELLKEAITGHRAGFRAEEELEGAEESAPAAAWKMVCSTCNDPVRIGKKWFEANQPVCGVCEEPFELVFE